MPADFRSFWDRYLPSLTAPVPGSALLSRPRTDPADLSLRAREMGATIDPWEATRDKRGDYIAPEVPDPVSRGRFRVSQAQPGLEDEIASALRATPYAQQMGMVGPAGQLQMPKGGITMGEMSKLRRAYRDKVDVPAAIASLQAQPYTYSVAGENVAEAPQGAPEPPAVGEAVDRVNQANQYQYRANMANYDAARTKPLSEYERAQIENMGQDNAFKIQQLEATTQARRDAEAERIRAADEKAKLARISGGAAAGAKRVDLALADLAEYLDATKGKGKQPEYAPWFGTNFNYDLSTFDKLPPEERNAANLQAALDYELAQLAPAEKDYLRRRGEEASAKVVNPEGFGTPEDAERYFSEVHSPQWTAKVKRAQDLRARLGGASALPPEGNYGPAELGTPMRTPVRVAPESDTQALWDQAAGTSSGRMGAPQTQPTAPDTIQNLIVKNMASLGLNASDADRIADEMRRQFRTQRMTDGQIQQNTIDTFSDPDALKQWAEDVLGR